MCKTLATLIKKGNITTYEWRTGEAPTSVVNTALLHSPVLSQSTTEAAAEKDELEVDWGDIDFGDETAGDGEPQEINYDLVCCMKYSSSALSTVTDINFVKHR